MITGETPPPLSLFYLLVFLRGDSLLHFSSGWNFLAVEGKHVVSSGSDHKHIPDYSLCCHSNPDSFLLRYMCPVLANSHVYNVHICVHTCNTQAIYYCDYYCFFFVFFQLIVLIPVRIFLVDGLCCRSLKGTVTRFFTRAVVSGVCGHFNEDIF